MKDQLLNLINKAAKQIAEDQCKEYSQLLSSCLSSAIPSLPFDKPQISSSFAVNGNGDKISGTISADYSEEIRESMAGYGSVDLVHIFNDGYSMTEDQRIKETDDNGNYIYSSIYRDGLNFIEDGMKSFESATGIKLSKQ